MPKTNKAQLIAELTQMGESPPGSWTVLELSTRLDELKEEKGVPKKVRGKVATPLRVWMIRLNEASKKKATLQAFVKDSLHLNLTMNETMPVLQRMAVQKIYMETDPCEEDPVGFGLHSSLSYRECLQQFPDYITWALKTWKEGECDDRLARLAMWAENEQNAASSSQGYQPPTHSNLEKKMPVKGDLSLDEGSATSSQIQQTNIMLAKLAEVVVELKADMDSMKEERPRKKDKGEDEMERDVKG